ncbi:Cof-type HAD-IIB family hydrolase [Clostridium vincentii]|uniref:Putative phosphatase YwpJ n=1 Tax=Clostridium vincentii TaxID=52704 RepID=A0A2T0B5Z2_9CLOT|nr:Cof-type HAD-IIB family hydrolase [Clostridium vincentii]PRR79318.1 putative phosphatase YwpJ [Clostridium vincentii]
MIKIIASDMDGTLLNSKHEIHEENIKAIKIAQRLGVQTVISTGREYETVAPLLKEAGLRCQCVLMNGAEYRDEDGNILERINIEKSKATQITDMVQAVGMRSEIFTSHGIYTTNTKEEALKGIAHMVQHFEKFPSFKDALEVAKVHPHFKILKYIENIEEFLCSEIEIRKILAFYSDEDIISNMKKKVNGLGGLAVSSSFKDNIEITDKLAQKGLTLAKVADKMGISRNEVIVIGDSFNDYSMFEEFKESFAMGNAIPEIKEIAKYVTDTNDEAGVAKAIYKALNL